MKNLIINLVAKYVLQVAVVSNQRCIALAYSEKVPKDFDKLMNEIKMK